MVNSQTGPVIVSRKHHNISRKQISPNALKVLYRLKDGGYEAYLVGGCIRDLLLGIQPKDFDVCTNATPEQIKKLFRNCRLIGRRFRLAHIVFGREVIEVATFRGHHQASQDKNQRSQQSDEGQLLRDNVYGSIDEDAERRDFSINALYYSINDFAIYDYAGGIEAINKRSIELIGDPQTRYREDPVRMLRAIRFATKLDMTISEAAERPIYEQADLLANIPPARLFEEVLKLFLGGKALVNYRALRQYGLMPHLFPALEDILTQDAEQQFDTAQASPEKVEQFIEQMLINTDERIKNNRKVTPAFIFAALLWYPLEKSTQALIAQGETPFDAFNIAMNHVLSDNAKQVAVPKRFTLGAREIWQMQHRLPRRAGQRAFRALQQPRFRAAYDFLLLRSEIEVELKPLAAWWTEFQESDLNAQKKMVQSIKDPSSGKRGRRPRRRRPPTKQATS